jgi:outer membrane immunogenic protein
MKRLSLYAILLGSFAIPGLAFAADMPLKAPALPVWSWTGFYVGGNIGGSFGRATTDWTVGGVPLGFTSQRLDGVVGGV